MIVEHRRVILRTPDENAKIGIVRSSHDNRRPNVIYALVIVVISFRHVYHLEKSIRLSFSYKKHQKQFNLISNHINTFTATPLKKSISYCQTYI